MNQLRERLQQHGTHTLTTGELLILALRTDSPSRALDTLLADSGGLHGLLQCDIAMLCQQHRLGPARTAQLLAILELARRLQSPPLDKYKIRCSDDAAKLVMPAMAYLDHEEIRVLVLDTKNQVVENISLYKGTVNSSVLRAAEIFRLAITRNCPGVIVCHNHPSGDPTPSPEDIQVTQQLVAAGQVLDIDLIDHLVIGNQRFVSLKERLRW